MFYVYYKYLIAEVIRVLFYPFYIIIVFAYIFVNDLILLFFAEKHCKKHSIQSISARTEALNERTAAGMHPRDLLCRPFRAQTIVIHIYIR